MRCFHSEGDMHNMNPDSPLGDLLIANLDLRDTYIRMYLCRSL